MPYQGEQNVNARAARGLRAKKTGRAGRRGCVERWHERSKQPGEAPDFTEAGDPFALFFAWMAEAEASEPADPEAMAVATVDADGLPNVRMILLKGADERGFVFYTNCESAKGNELAANPKAALLFYWKSLGRQIRMRGPVEPATRSRGRRLFRHPPSREPHRRLRLAPVAAARLARGARGRSRAPDRGLRRGPGGAARPIGAAIG